MFSLVFHKNMKLHLQYFSSFKKFCSSVISKAVFYTASLSLFPLFCQDYIYKIFFLSFMLKEVTNFPRYELSNKQTQTMQHCTIEDIFQRQSINLIWDILTYLGAINPALFIHSLLASGVKE